MLRIYRSYILLLIIKKLYKAETFTVTTLYFYTISNQQRIKAYDNLRNFAEISLEDFLLKTYIKLLKIMVSYF